MHPEDELALYALDALEGDERDAVEAHLASCPSCLALVDEHRATLAALTADEAPPPAVWQRIAADIGAADVPTPLPVDAVGRRWRHRPRRPPPRPRARSTCVPGPAPTAPAGRWSARPPPRPWSSAAWWASPSAVPRTSPTDLAELAAAALDDPDATVATLATGDGQDAARVVVDGTTGYVLVDDLPQLPEGEEYQLWKLGAEGDVPVSLGVIGDGSTGRRRRRGPGRHGPAGPVHRAGAAARRRPTGAIVATGEFA